MIEVIGKKGEGQILQKGRKVPQIIIKAGPGSSYVSRYSEMGLLGKARCGRRRATESGARETASSRECVTRNRSE